MKQITFPQHVLDRAAAASEMAYEDNGDAASEVAYDAVLERWAKEHPTKVS